MSYYTQVQRMSDGDAARVFEELSPSLPARRAASRFLAEILTHAGARTSSWSVTLDSDSVRVNVGPVRVASLAKGGLWFCATVGNFSPLPSSIQVDRSLKKVAYRSVPVPSRGYLVDASQVRMLPALLRRAALEYVEEAACRRGGRSPWIRAHSPGVLEFLESFLGLQLPRHEASPSSAPVGAETQEPRALFEGAAVQLCRDTFARSRAARAACIAHYGDRCSICDVKLSERYGAIAEGLIHVHHPRSLSAIRQKHEVNPIRDLRPVCPNCHAIVHLSSPPLSIERARALVRERS